MTRNLKALGLALVAALVVSGVVASVASANVALFTANVGADSQAEIHGEQHPGTKNTFTLAGLPPITCETVTETGHPEQGGAHKVGPSAASLTLTPTFDTCHIKLGVLTRTVTITLNGCTFTRTATKNTNSTPFSADFTICPGGQKIEIHVYNTSSHNDTGATTLCTYDIQGDQTFNNQIELTNTATHDVTEDINVSGIDVHNTMLSGTCGPSTNTTATYTGVQTLRATNGIDQFVDSTVS